MNSYEPGPVNLMDDIDDFTDLLKFDVNYQDSSNFKLPFLDDDEVRQEEQPWSTNDLCEPVNDNSSDSGISSISVKHEPYSPDGSLLSPSPVYSDSTSHPDALSHALMTDVLVFTDGHNDVLPFLNEFSPPSSPFSNGSQSSMEYSPASLESGICLPHIVQQECAPRSDTGVLSQAEVANLVADARVTRVLQSKVKIQPKPDPSVSAALATIPVSSVLGECRLSGAARPDPQPLVVTAEDFARLTAQGVLKFHPPAATTAASSSCVVSVTTGSSNTGNVVAMAAGVKRPLQSSGSMQGIMPGSCLADDGDDSCKALKKQQRMIKNRESASLSRKRRKEYMSSLEQMLQQCSAENDALKQENDALRRRIEALQAENDRLKSTFPVNKKATATCVMTLAFLVAVKIASLSAGQLPVEELLKQQAFPRPAIAQAGKLPNVHLGRNLLSVNDDQSWTDNASISSHDEDILGGKSEHLNNSKSAELMVVKDYGNPLCPTNVAPYNGSDSQRLANELSGWALRSKIAAKKTKMQPSATPRSRAAGRSSGDSKRRSLAPTSATAAALRSSRLAASSSYAMQVYGSRDSTHGKFFDAIRRRNDTFYVISFRMDHWLLPATAHNKTTRPKMAILVPALPLNESTRNGDIVTMLQIECEVMDTRFLRLDQSVIPQHTAWYQEYSAAAAAAGTKPAGSTSYEFKSLNSTASRRATAAAEP